MSGTLTNIRLRALSMRPDKFSAIQLLTTGLVLTLSKMHLLKSNTHPSRSYNIDRQRLWRFGISGDKPIVLVFAGIPESLGLIRSLAQALQLWTWGGVPCDLVIINREPASYEMALQREMAALRDRHLADSASRSDPSATSFHLLRSDSLTIEELATLQALSSLRFLADGRPLIHHVQALLDRHEVDFDERHEGTRTSVARVTSSGLPGATSQGDFVTNHSEFQFHVHGDRKPKKPWINVLSNPHFGAQISEAGGGYSWAVNSRLNQLTAWSNDPVADPLSEWFLIQDRRTSKVWSVSPCAWGAEKAAYRITHGQGYTNIEHEVDDLRVSTSWCVDIQSSVKQVTITVKNTGTRSRQLRLIGLLEWAMGANRSSRSTTYTALYREDLINKEDHLNLAKNPRSFHVTALLCTQQDYSAGFGGGTAFLAAASSDLDDEDWTCDRREFFDARGSLVLPLHFGQRSGLDLDPCGALSIKASVNAGETIEQTFLIGYGSSSTLACNLATETALKQPSLRLAQVRQQWQELLGATEVKTPDPLFDAMVNRWLIYQTLSSRLWAKAGFYQAGGATGFRDQLQDAMALTWSRPEILHHQILLAASRQFPEGDVQHWWHAPTGAGVRTHFSDDLLWLAYALIHYLKVTGDNSILDQEVHYIEGSSIPSGEEDSYSIPRLSDLKSTVFEHAARAIDRSLNVGAHGLPLMGSGDWNDGMNRVGHLGLGESVWLGWFLCKLVADMAPLARARHDGSRADTWEASARAWKSALTKQAWDGNWFKRAFFDNGKALGSSNNPEAKIDLIAQAWSVLSNAAPIELQKIAMASVEAHLVDHDAGLIRLLAPPLKLSSPSAGYIQAYPPGVRENGGQYSHGAVWALIAQADLARKRGGTVDGTTAYRYFKYLSSAHRSKHPKYGQAYEIEPYAMAGDVYAYPPYTGRGGWSWYTGAAAWMHRAATESIFGLTLGAEFLKFNPCLPLAWQQAEMTLRKDGRELHFYLRRVISTRDLETLQFQLQAELALKSPQSIVTLNVGENLPWASLAGENIFLIPIL
jgi:cyclic beta-1,2-glucan synthetase